MGPLHDVGPARPVRARTERAATAVLLTALLIAPCALALPVSVTDRGIDARVVQRAHLPGLFDPLGVLTTVAPGITGAGIGIGQVEIDRPGLPGFDDAAHAHPGVVPAAVFNQAGAAAIDAPSGETDQHAENVAGVMISGAADVPGVAPAARLFASADTGPDQASSVVTAQHVATRNAGDVRAVNMSFGILPAAGAGGLNGNDLFTQFVDWSAQSGQHDTLHVVAGNEMGPAAGRSVPTDNFNGVTVGYTRQQAGVFSAIDPGNIFNDLPADGRTTIDLVAPGTDIRMPDLGGGSNVSSGTSFAAPHVAATVALLQQFGDKNIANASPLWDADARRHEVSKVVLMNSADKVRGILGMGKTILDTNNMDWRASNAFNNVAIPLDDQLGTGQLNARRALLQFDGGEWDPGQAVPVIGWDLDGTTGAGSLQRYALRETLADDGYISVTLAWDRSVSLVDGAGGTAGRFDTGEAFNVDGLTDMNLYLVPRGKGITDAVARSVSAVDSVEHVFAELPATGDYDILVQQVNAPVGNQEYALAWWAEPATRPRTGGVSFSVDGGALNPARVAPNPAEGINTLPQNVPPNDVFTLGLGQAGAVPGSHGLATEGEIFVSGSGGLDTDPDGTNIDRLSGALGTLPPIGPHLPTPAPAPDRGVGVLGLIPDDNVIGLSYGKDSGDVLYFSVDPASVGAAGTDVFFHSTLSPPVAGVGAVPFNPGGGDPGDEAAGDIYASQRFDAFGSYRELHLALGKVAPLVAPPGDNRLLYDERDLGLQAPALQGSALGPAEDDLDALELADPGDPVWGADFNESGALEASDDPVWFSLDPFSPSVGVATRPFGGPLPLFTASIDPFASADDFLMTPPGFVGFREDLDNDVSLDAGEDLNFNGILDPFVFGIYASGVLDVGLLPGDIVDAIVLSDEGRFGWLDPVIDNALFSLAPGSPSLAVFGASAADVFFTDFTGMFDPLLDWKLGGSLYASHDALGLLFSDNLNALDIRPVVPEPETLLLAALGLLALCRRQRRASREWPRAAP